MSTERSHSTLTQNRSARLWRTLLDAYRYVNIATHHTLGAILKLLVVLYFIFCALFLTLRYAVLPNIDRYKGEVEQLATSAIGRPVSIGTLGASWRGLQPHLLLNDVVIHDRNGYKALILPKVSATVSWFSVAVADLRLSMLEIDQPNMDIQRDASGNLYVAGIFIDTQKSGSGKGADWILSQPHVVVHDGRIRWNDLKRGAPELALTGVNLVLRNRWRHHQLSLQATPPASFAAPLDVRAEFTHPPLAKKISDATRWQGEFYVGLQHTDLAIWKTYVDYPFEIMQGQGSVRAWLAFDQAKVANFTADLILSNVSTRLAKDLRTLDLVQVKGRVSAREEFDAHLLDGPTFGKNGHTVSLTDFSFQTKDGLIFPATTISEKFVPAQNSQPERIEVKAKLLDLQTLAKFADHLPFPAAQRQILADFSPRGQLKDFSAQWQGTYPNISSYNIKGQFFGLSMNALLPRLARPPSSSGPAQAALPAIPGFDNLTGSVSASDRGGAFNLASTNLKVYLPRYFLDPEMPFDQLNMQANWTFQKNDQVLLKVDKMDFVQEGVSGSLSGSHLMPLNSRNGKPLGIIDVSGKISEFDVIKIGRYLPVQTHEKLRHWLVGALVSGKARDVAIKLKGDLNQFPFRPERPGDKPRGEFRIAAKIENGRLNYVPEIFAEDGTSPLWPHLEEINGSIVLDRARMEIKASTAKTFGVGLANVKTIIPDLFSHDIQLEIEGRASGALQNFVAYTKASPVANWIGHFTEETKASGNAVLDLKLHLPLARLLESKVQGELQFSNNDISLQPAIPALLATNGTLKFHEKGFDLPATKASFLGAPVSVTGGTQRDGTIAIKADGSVTTEGLRRAYPAPAMQRLLRHLSGSTRYSALISVKNKRPEIIVESTLRGIGFDFPAPLRKLANQVWPLKVGWSVLPTDNELATRDEIKLSLGTAIAARYQRKKMADKNAAWQVERGGIGINVPAPQPDSGVIANVSLKSLNVDAWSNFVTAVTGNDRQAGAPDATNISLYFPDVLAARATELILMGRPLDKVVVGASHQKGVWQANIDSRQVSGHVTWNESTSERGPGKATARLTSLIIPKSAASDVTEILAGEKSSTQIPGLDVVAENFELFGKKFGRLELVASNAGAAGAREWRIGRLALLNADAELSASGKWSIKDGENLSGLNFALDIADAGKLLDRLGFVNVVRGGKGKMNGDISWRGLPYSLDIPTLSGQFVLDLASGQFLKVDPSAAKLLSVLSLQSLPRRLLFDFRDVFSEGFSFDGVVGTATIDRGILKTDNFKMRSVSVTVLMDGIVDIAKETQNLHVVMLPEINAGAASVVYGLAVNPIIGLGSFLAQLFLRVPLMRAFTSEYQITGTWKDPLTTKLDPRSKSTSSDNAPASRSSIETAPQGLQ